MEKPARETQCCGLLFPGQARRAWASGAGRDLTHGSLPFWLWPVRHQPLPSPTSGVPWLASAPALCWPHASENRLALPSGKQLGAALESVGSCIEQAVLTQSLPLPPPRPPCCSDLQTRQPPAGHNMLQVCVSHLPQKGRRRRSCPWFEGGGGTDLPVSLPGAAFCPVAPHRALFLSPL